eukprot:TRINITY_DN28484_c0_g1_i1.p1 TRINITY_DN28484_c0_g1~~TRINITY_DN28484_c0_g1_i1.p1  ORF type:complete len:391 (-),score=76.50 TRINITY_DN28484_c0_g1_i1:327-1499(-)
MEAEYGPLFLRNLQVAGKGSMTSPGPVPLQRVQQSESSPLPSTLPITTPLQEEGLPLGVSASIFPSVFPPPDLTMSDLADAHAAQQAAEGCQPRPPKTEASDDLLSIAFPSEGLLVQESTAASSEELCEQTPNQQHSCDNCSESNSGSQAAPFFTEEQTSSFSEDAADKAAEDRSDWSPKPCAAVRYEENTPGSALSEVVALLAASETLLHECDYVSLPSPKRPVLPSSWTDDSEDDDDDDAFDAVQDKPGDAGPRLVATDRGAPSRVAAAAAPVLPGGVQREDSSQARLEREPSGLRLGMMRPVAPLGFFAPQARPMAASQTVEDARKLARPPADSDSDVDCEEEVRIPRSTPIVGVTRSQRSHQAWQKAPRQDITLGLHAMSRLFVRR